LASGLLGPQAVKPVSAEGVRLAGDGFPVDAEVGGDVLAGAALVGHEDDLEVVPEFSVNSRR
jgi:hypothetical protein